MRTCLLLVATALAVATPKLATAELRVDDVDAPMRVLDIDMTLDPAGEPLLALGGDALRLVRWTGVDWSIEVVAEVCQTQTSIAAAADGRLALSYRESGGELFVAYWDGSNWDHRPVDADATDDHAVAFDDSGTPLIAYRSLAASDLMFATWNGAGWDREIADSPGDVGGYLDLAVDSNGRPGIAYHDRDNRHAKFAHRLSPGNWQLETIDASGSAAGFYSVRFDSGDEPAVSYWGGNASGLWVARRMAGVWSPVLVDPKPNVGLYSTLRFDRQGKPLVAYRDPRDGDLRLARFDGSDWSTSVVASVGSLGLFASVAVTADDSVILAHVISGPRQELLIERETPAGWVQTAAAPSKVLVYSSLAYTPDGAPVIAYASQDLEVARWTGRGWELETAVEAERPAWSDSGYTTGNFADLAIDSTGHPAVTYSALSGAEPRLARWDGGAWNVETIEVAPTAQGNSLAFAPDGNPAVSFLRDRPFELAYARHDGTDFLDVPVPVAGALDDTTSLTFDPSGNPAIAYMHRDTRTVRLARWNGSGWDDVEVAVVAHIQNQAGAEIEFTDSGEAIVAYQDVGTDEVFVARDGSGSFVSVVVDSARAYAHGLAMAVRPPGDHITLGYPDQDSNETRIATWDGSGWTVASHDELPIFIGVAYDPAGNASAVWTSDCTLDIRFARPVARIHRALADPRSANWKGLVLPLTTGNDDETAPFPIEAGIPWGADDTAPGPSLTLYRALDEAGAPANASLYLRRAGGDVDLRVVGDRRR